MFGRSKRSNCTSPRRVNAGTPDLGRYQNDFWAQEKIAHYQILIAKVEDELRELEEKLNQINEYYKRYQQLLRSKNPSREKEAASVMEGLFESLSCITQSWLESGRISLAQAEHFQYWRDQVRGELFQEKMFQLDSAKPFKQVLQVLRSEIQQQRVVRSGYQEQLKRLL